MELNTTSTQYPEMSGSSLVMSRVKGGSQVRERAVEFNADTSRFETVGRGPILLLLMVKPVCKSE